MPVKLSDLALHQTAVIVRVDDTETRLGEIGFIPGEQVCIIARAFFNGPLAVRVGSSTFALRREEADLIWVSEKI